MSKRRIRIAFVTIWYPVAMSRYICDALCRRDDCEVWTAGPFTDNWIPWGGGMYLPRKYVFTPDLPISLMPGHPPSVAYPVLEAQAPHEMDLWIEGNAGLQSTGRPKAPFIGIGTDPHVLDYDGLRSRVDRFHSMQRVYAKPGDSWLPYAYDPVWHSPTAIPAREREYDAALIGLHYEKRTRVMSELAGQGRQVYYGLGPAYDDARAVYHSTRIGLNWSSLMDLTARAFEVMAFGIAPLLNLVPDLVALFAENEHFVGFTSHEEALLKARDLLADPDRIDALGAAARKAVEPHTWDARADQILREAGLVK